MTVSANHRAGPGSSARSISTRKRALYGFEREEEIETCQAIGDGFRRLQIEARGDAPVVFGEVRLERTSDGAAIDALYDQIGIPHIHRGRLPNG
jgi:hypothetical protein